jgi:predicted naringenin-chalcone synthase
LSIDEKINERDFSKPIQQKKKRTDMRKKNGKVFIRQAPEYPCKYTQIHTPEKELNKYR